MSSKQELKNAQRDVHRSIATIGKGIGALSDALTVLVLAVDQSVERLLAAETTLVQPANKGKSKRR